MASLETPKGRRAAAEKVLDAVDELQTGGEKLLEEWDGGLAKRTISFYHAEGAPYLDDDGKFHPSPPPEEMADLERQGLAVPPTIFQALVAEVVPIKHENVVDEIYVEKAPVPAAKRTKGASEERTREDRRQEGGPAAARRAQERPAQEHRSEDPSPEEDDEDAGAITRVPTVRVNRMFDLGGIEQLAFMALNSVFPGGLTVPIRREGLANFDVTIKGKEILVDVHGPLADIPALGVWRITFAFEGEPLMIWGRGVKGDLKVFRFRVVRFMIRAWRAKRKRKRLARLEQLHTWKVAAAAKISKGGTER